MTTATPDRRFPPALRSLRGRLATGRTPAARWALARARLAAGESAAARLVQSGSGKAEYRCGLIQRVSIPR